MGEIILATYSYTMYQSIMSKPGSKFSMKDLDPLNNSMGILVT